LPSSAALAGAHHLPGNAAAAQQAAANYAVSGLNGGTIPTGCSPPATGGPLPTGCDPSPPHTLTITTPYEGNTSEILVRLDHTDTLNLAALVGVSSAKTASRSVARSFSGGQPFGYAVYAGGDITQNGNADAFVNGNVYAQGCVRYGNAGTFKVTPQGALVGSVELYNKDNVSTAQQSWTSGSGTGCTVKVDGTTGPNQWGAFGHVSGNENCGPLGTLGAGFVDASCPSAEPPVPFVAPPQFTPAGPTGCPGSPSASPSGQSTASPGCYNACSAVTSGNTVFPNVVFQPGTYGFVGNGTTGGCNVILSGTAAGTGVTFYLYNGTSFCNDGSTNGASCKLSNNSDITFSAPTGSTDPNFGMLIYSCGTPCGTGGSGLFFIKGPAANISLQGTVYNPGGDCVVDANGASRITGQLICNNVQLQGGTVSTGTGVTYGGNLLPTPNFAAQLIE
jgi:hypothetical protein